MAGPPPNENRPSDFLCLGSALGNEWVRCDAIVWEVLKLTPPLRDGITHIVIS